MKKIRPLIIVLTTIIVIITLYNKVIDLLANFSHKLVSINQYIYRWKFGEISYSKKGTGTPVLLLHHTNLGGSDFEFQTIINDLSLKHTVYTLDLLGYGRSDKPKMTYTAFIYVQLINDFIKNIIKEPTHVITSGDSSIYIMLLTLLNPKSIKNIILSSPSSLVEYSKSPNKTDRFLKELIELPMIGTFIYNILTIRPIIKKQFTNRLSPNYYVKKRQIDGLFESAHINGTGNRFTYVSQLYHFTKADIRKAIQSTTHSIYLIVGENTAMKDVLIEQYEESNPSIEISILKDAKQYPHLENVEAFLEITDFFLQ